MPQEVRTTNQSAPAASEGAQRMPPRPVFLPPADIYETPGSIVVLAEMPGVPSDGVDITLERRVLTVRGRTAAAEHAGYQRVYNEYADGDYERSPKISTATGSKRGSRTVCCILSCRRQKRQRQERSSSSHKLFAQ